MMAFSKRKSMERQAITMAENGFFILALRDLGYNSDMIAAILHHADIRRAICSSTEAQAAFVAFAESRPGYAS